MLCEMSNKERLAGAGFALHCYVFGTLHSRQKVWLCSDPVLPNDMTEEESTLKGALAWRGDSIDEIGDSLFKNS
jgi:hypothetical protein